MQVSTLLVAHDEAAKAGEPSQGALNHPAVAAEYGSTYP